MIPETEHRPPVPKRPKAPRQLTLLLHWVLIVSGFVAIALAIIGIFLPVLPTVPFLLLALACFARSSERFYLWLQNHSHLGPLVRPYMQGNGITHTTKLKAIILIWISIGTSTVFFIERIWLQLLLLIIAIGVSIYLLRLPNTQTDTREGPKKPRE